MASDRDNDDGARPSWIASNLPPEIVQSELFVFKVMMPNGGSVEVNIANDVEIDYERLEEQMDQVPGQYVWWASVYSEARAFVTLLERRIKIRKGILIEAAMSQARDQGGFKLTEKQTEKIVEADEKIVKWEMELIKAQKNVGKLYHMVQAISMKSELLRSRSGFKRQELEQQR